ncbi:MAG: hypothetical protein K5668_10340 [Lachnospiraceae bacterium]|nr:hypothetical protein [Lachnospiraceae bacterium]
MNLRARIIACVCIISVLVSLVFLSNGITNLKHEPQYTYDSPAVVTNNGIYFGENWDGSGHLYLINSDGSIKYMTDSNGVGEKRISAVTIADGYVYALYGTVTLINDDEPHVCYRLVKMTPDLKVTGVGDHFTINYLESVVSMSCENGIVYITTIEVGGRDVNVYTREAESIQPVTANLTLPGVGEEHENEKLEEPEVFLYRDNNGGSFYTRAFYEEGVLEVLTDREVPTGRFLPDSRIRNAVSQIHFTLAQNMVLYSKYISWWLIGLLIWLAVLAAIHIALQRRNRMVYVFFVTEVVLFIILASGFYFISNHYSSIAKKENARYAALVVDYELNELGDLDRYGMESKDYLRSDEYGQLLNELKTFMDNGKNKGFFEDIFIMRLKDGMIMTSYEGCNFTDAAFAHGRGMTELRNTLSRDPRDASNDAEYDDFMLEAVGVTGGNPAAKYALVGVYISGKYYAGIWADSLWVLVIFLITFLLGTILVAFVMFIQNMDLREFETAMRDVALGRNRINFPRTPAEDMKAMWASLGELKKKMEEINYDKYRIFEGYYRFAPKNIETIMGRESIFDVNNGDVTNTEGTLMLVSTERTGYGEKRINSLKNIVSYMSQFTDREDGILVSEDSSLSILQFLFLKESRMVASQTTQFLHRNASDEDSGFISVFLYYDKFMYGVVGVNTQSLVFLTSPHSREMEAYAEWFQDMRLPLVVTEDVIKRENVGERRYIGFIIPDGERELKLYEVLDACDAKQRQLKISNRHKFEETLGLFYSKDFYLARNNFSEVLRDCPDDQMARWYLFECERYLNGDGDMESSGSIRISD